MVTNKISLCLYHALFGKNVRMYATELRADIVCLTPGA
jgi:hypothetical protein